MALYSERPAIADEFSKQVTLSPERITELSHQIQERGRNRPDLLEHCRFGRSMEARRLREVSSRYWNNADWNNAETIIDLIAQFRAHAGPEYTLALAVLGGGEEGLDEALQALDLPFEDYAGDTLAASASVVVTEAPTRPERPSKDGPRKSGNRQPAT